MTKHNVIFEWDITIIKSWMGYPNDISKLHVKWISQCDIQMWYPNGIYNNDILQWYIKIGQFSIRYVNDIY